jgi:Ca-activated chloride channel homolog
MRMSMTLAALGIAALGLWKPQPAEAKSISAGLLARLDKDGAMNDPCPLEHTAVTAEATGPVARVTVRQIFRNPTDGPIEAIYTFPLAAGGAVDAMTLRIGDRVVKGAIKTKEEARAIYDAARRQGKLTGLLDQERPNVFVQQVANIPPNAKVEVEIQYVETLRYEAGRYQFVFPMTVGPRYSPGHNPGAFRNPQYAAPGTRAGHDISFSMKIDAGLAVDVIDSTTHEVVVENRTASGGFLKLRNQKEIPNKDLIVRWDVAGRKINDALLAHRTGDKYGYFTFVLAPPDEPAREDITPKELVFVIDTSGSMHGFPLDKAKEAMMAAIEGLHPRDRFNLITFAGDTHLLFPEPVDATAANVAAAKSFLAGRRAGGGTEMMKAIRASLAPSSSRDHVRIVCFMTDGYVGNEAEIIAEIRKNPGARVFGFGIGSSVNRHLMDQMSLQGRGEVEYVGLQDDGSAAAPALPRARADSPVDRHSTLLPGRRSSRSLPAPDSRSVQRQAGRHLGNLPGSGPWETADHRPNGRPTVLADHCRRPAGHRESGRHPLPMGADEGGRVDGRRYGTAPRSHHRPRSASRLDDALHLLRRRGAQDDQ